MNLSSTRTSRGEREMSRSRRVQSPPAVVLGAGVNLIEVVRSLALAGAPSAVVAPDHDAAGLSRHVTTIMRWKWSDPGASADEADLLRGLAEFARGKPAPPPLLFTSDEALLFVCRHRDELSGAYRFVIADSDRVEALVDKARFATLAHELGFRAPRTLVLRPPLDAAPGRIAGLGFPLIVKPNQRDRSWHESIGSTKKAVQVRDEGELVRLWPCLTALAAPVLVQESVPGRESRLESYHVYIDADGRTAGEFAGRKIRTVPSEFGHTTALVVTDAEDVLEQGRELLRLVGLRGVAKVDFKRAPDGRLYVLEINPRFHLWHHAGALAGVNIPALVYADLTYRSRPAAGLDRPGVRWVHPRDLFAAKADGLTRWQWIRWGLGCEAKAFWAWDDPLPLIAAVAARIPLRR
jgi:D-aspartate ligase